MGSEPPPTQPAGPPAPPSPGASRDEWRAWRRGQREYVREQWHADHWYGPWDWWGGGWFLGAALVLVGGYYLLQNLGLLKWIPGNVLWPALLILFGLWLLVRRGRDWRH